MSRLSEYIKSRREEQDLLSTDAARIKEEWLQELDKLMDTIDQWLRPSVEAGLKVTKATVPISEERLGTYIAPKRVIEFTGRRVEVEPKARVIVGGHGRVDVRSSVGTAFLIFSKPEGLWFIVKDRDWTNRETFTQDSFERLMEAFL